LHRTAEVVPGTVVFSTRTADVVIGLLLLMLSHGLRRRKHRAWQAVILLLGTLAFYHREFYAVGDPGTRWRALATLVGLVIADVVIGLTFIALSRDLF